MSTYQPSQSNTVTVTVTTGVSAPPQMNWVLAAVVGIPVVGALIAAAIASRRKK